MSLGTPTVAGRSCGKSTSYVPTAIVSSARPRTRVAKLKSPQRYDASRFVSRVYQVERPGVVLQSTDALEAELRTYHQPAVLERETLPYLMQASAEKHANYTAVMDPHKTPVNTKTYREVVGQIRSLAAAFQSWGLAKNDKVSLFAENSSRWIVADQAIMWSGGVDAVRGSSAPLDELTFILHNSNSCAAVLEDAETLKKLTPELKGAACSHFKFVVVMWGAVSEELRNQFPFPVYSFDDACKMGQESLSFTPVPVSAKDPATLVYTSGTSGHPKGVLLSHGNLAYQVLNMNVAMTVNPGDNVLSLLPPWHIYERSCSYFVFYNGGKMTYTNIRKFRDDLTKYPPHHFVCVPLVLNTLYDKVMAKFKQESSARRTLISAFMSASTAYVRARRVVEGLALQFAQTARPTAQLVQASLVMFALAPIHALATKLVYSKIRAALGIKSTVISGGGSLAPHLDDFYEVIGLEVLNGWGLSETSPVLACRRARPGQNVRGSIGRPITHTELKVVDPETLEEQPDGSQGLILARGPGVMQGYYRDEAATARAFRAGGGWFDTGDLGWRAPAGVEGSNMAGCIVLTGRAKDTLVLSNGKNIEPQPIEDALCSIPLVKHVILVGQDKRELGALVFPDKETLDTYQAETGKTLSPAELEDLLSDQVAQYNKARPDYHAFEHVAHIAVLDRPLSVDDGTLTRTMKPRRAEIMKVYKTEVEGLLHRLRG